MSDFFVLYSLNAFGRQLAIDSPSRQQQNHSVFQSTKGSTVFGRSYFLLFGGNFHMTFKFKNPKGSIARNS
jgi:hypothetical protein